MLTRPLIVMGVSGAGKSTLARAIATRFGYRFVEGDDCHPPANVAKMTAGIALDDDDRLPFLNNVAAAINAVPSGAAVASCSALKRRYRDLLRSRCDDPIFVLPHPTHAVLLRRMRERAHFMPEALLDSQLATLELPGPDEAAIVLDGAVGVQELVLEVARRISRGCLTRGNHSIDVDGTNLKSSHPRSHEV